MINKSISTLTKEERWKIIRKLINAKLSYARCLEDPFSNEELVWGKEIPGAYIFLHPLTLQFYIGSTDDLYERKYKHFWYIAKGNHRNHKVRNAFNDNPTDKIFFFTWLTKTKEAALNLEQYFLDLYFDNERSLNIAPDARFNGKGLKRSEEVKKRISDTVTQQWKDPNHRELKSQLMKKFFSDPKNLTVMRERTIQATNTPEHKERQRLKANEQWNDSEARKRKSEEVKAYQLLHGKKVIIDNIVYPHVHEAARRLGIDYSTLKHRIKSPKIKWVNYQYYKQEIK